MLFNVEWRQRTFGRKSDSSTSKLDVSVGLLTSGVNGGSVSLKCSQSKPLKNGWFIKSSMPFWPRRFSGVAIRRHIMSLASSDTSSMSSGNFNCAWKELKIHNKLSQVFLFKLSTKYLNVVPSQGFFFFGFWVVLLFFFLLFFFFFFLSKSAFTYFSITDLLFIELPYQ